MKPAVRSIGGEDLNDSGVPYGSRWEGPATFDIVIPDNDETVGDGLPDAWEDLFPCLESTSLDTNGNQIGDAAEHL